MERTDPYGDILERGRRNQKSYAASLKTLKRRKHVSLDRRFAEVHDEVFSKIDCLLCTRCCGELGPRLTDSDIGRLARRERIKPSAFQDAYLRTDEDGDSVFASLPCPFLGVDGYCGVYEDRPKACRDYPHLTGNRKDFLSLHIKNLSYCPAVVLAVEMILSDK